MALCEVDSERDQCSFLREATKYFQSIEKPLKSGPSIETLTDLIGALHKEFELNHVNVQMINHIMLSYKSNYKEWKKFAKFDRYKYTRNLVDAGNGKFNLMILCWGEGHSSAIHDHADSHCFMKMLKGELKETRYMMPPTNCFDNEMSSLVDIGHDLVGSMDSDEDLHEMGHSHFSLDQVAYINDNIGLHRVENPSHTETAVSLHLYCPPFNACSVYQKNSCKRVKCPVTFWSQYGVRVVNND